MSKIKKRFNREARRKLLHKGRVRAGCLLAAFSLVALTAGAGQVQAADPAKDTGKKIVSENKTKSDKKKDKKSGSVSKDKGGQEDKKAETSPTHAASGAPQEVKSPVKDADEGSAEGEAGKEGIPGAEPEKTEIDTDTETDDAETDTKTDIDTDTDETSQGSGPDGKDADPTGPAATPTPTTSAPGEADPGSASGDPEDSGTAGTASGDTSDGQDPDTGVPSQSISPDGAGTEEEPVHTEETAPVPVAGILEGASTVIVGGLAPAVPEGTPGQEEINTGAESNENDTEDDAGKEHEEEGSEEPRSRIAGSTPLVGGVITGEVGGGSQTTVTPRPTTVPSKTPTPASGGTGDRAAVTAVPTTAPSSTQQEQRVALDDAGAGQQTSSAVQNTGPTAGSLRASVETEDSTKIVPFILAGVAALIAVVAFAVLKIKKGRRDPDPKEPGEPEDPGTDDPSEQDQE